MGKITLSSVLMRPITETSVCEKVAAVSCLELYSLFVKEFSDGFRFLLVPRGAEFSFAFRPASWHGLPTINVRVFAASFFAQRRARNANDTRLTADEAQGIVGRRKMIGEEHLTLPPSCLVCA